MQSTLWVIPLLVGLLAALVSGLVIWLKMGRQLKQRDEALANLQTEQAVADTRMENLQQQLTEQRQQTTDALQLTEQLRDQLSEVREQAEGLRRSEQGLMAQLQQMRQEHELVRSDSQQLQRQLNSLQAENSELRTRQEEKEQHYAAQLAQFEQQKQELSKEFENLANRIFDAKGKSFSENSRQSLDDLLKPFKQQINDFRQKVEDIHHKETQQQAALRSELGHLKELNKQITEEAHQLATALKGQKKTQGNWGELILENVLDRSGLQKDKDYKREASFTTEKGRQRPDVIVYLPENKHLIVDAKVSLNAYTRYINSDEEAERQQALKEHVSAIADRIKELSDRNYFELPGLNSPEMVFMFIPIESAFVEALRADETLFQKALEQNVLVATPTTLLTSLNIVRQLWRFEDQNRHTAELAEKASKVYDKLNSFLKSMGDLGNSLDKAKDTYDKAFGQLYTGRGNLIKQASEFKKLGVAVKSELPENLVEKAELELQHSIEESKG